ncbi:FMN reductase [Leucobacter exalbidus]|uniref:FMN reductase n=1 Tax=Leucobacter exalbidus TaxID=662960 RepID=A0A940T3T1_9MICO|nr:CE1759 family FMN reductase [Leucobacter exalbidus]MBP1326133.1 FMN reductase [Leucobacter exalbidus]
MNAPLDGHLPAANSEPAQTPAASQQPLTLAVVTAGTSDPSTSTMLAQRVADKFATLAAGQGRAAQIRVINLRLLAADITTALVSQHVSEELQAASDILRDADAIVAATPVYKAGASGLFTSFFQVLDNDLLIGTPVALAATAGSPRHALVVDDQLRGVFAYLRTITTPTSIFAAPDDWTSSELGGRITRQATELFALAQAGFRETVRGNAWNSYQHTYGSAGGTELGIEFDTDLMRLATGGK